MTGQLLLSLVAVALGGAGLLFAYVLLKPALFIAILSATGMVAFLFCLTPTARHAFGYRPLVVAIGLPLIAWLTPNIWLLYALMGALLPALATRIGQVAPLYLFSVLLLPGLDQTIHLGSVKLFEFGVHDALALGAAIAFMRRGGKWGGNHLDAPFWALLVLLVAALARNTSVTNFIRLFINAGLDFALPYYIVSRGLRTPEDFRSCMLHLAGAAAILSLVLIYEVRSSWPLYNMLYEHYGIGLRLLVKARGGMIRAAGPCLESTSMALVLLLCATAAWLSGKAFASRLRHAGMLALMFVGLLAPQSRGAWIGMVVAAVAADMVRGQMKLVIRRGLLAGAGVIVLLGMAQASPRLAETLGLSGGGSAETVDYRQRLFDRGMEEFRKRPLLGDPLPVVTAKLSDLRQGEGIVDFVNTYIYVALLAGVVGLTTFMGSFLLLLLRLWQQRRMAIRRDTADFLALSFAGLVTLMEMLFFTSFDGRVSLFTFVFIAFASAQLAQPRRLPAAQPLSAPTSA